MKFQRIFVFAFLVLTGSPAAAQKWKKVSTVREVYNSYPERVNILLQSLDLNRKGLERVRAASERRDPVAACEALLAYYRDGTFSGHLRHEQPAISARRNGTADSILQDIFTFYALTDKVPRKPNGQLDWSHDGPDDDIEWAWGLNRHAHLSQLMRVYFETGNPDYAKAIDEHLQDWVLSSLPYPGVKSSTPMWRGLEVALRAKVWVRVFYGLVNSDYLTPATRILMLSSIPDHTHYLRNFHAKSGNWPTMELSGLAMVATAWPEFRGSDEWVAYAKSEMLFGLKDQVYPDGVQKELTSHYHEVALGNFKHFLDICNKANVPLPDGYEDVLESMTSYDAYSMTPSGYGILNNDSDTRFIRNRVLSAAKEYGREDWLFIASNGKKGTRPPGSPSVVFPWAGQVIMRSDYDTAAHWAFFDIGPWGTGHQHSDKLHLSVAAYGRDLLVDGGRFAYRGEFARRFRGYAKGSASHNVVLVDGKGQGPGPDSVEEPLDKKHYRNEASYDYAWGSFDQFPGVEGAVNHNRSVFYLRDRFWIVVDRIETDRPRKIETLWHWHPRSKVQIGENKIAETDHDYGNLKVIPVGYDKWDARLVKGQEDPLQGWFSEYYNKAEPSPATIYSTQIKDTTTLVWILQPSKENARALSAEVIRTDGEGIAVRVTDESSNNWEVTVPFRDSYQASYEFTAANEKRIRTGKLYDIEGAKTLLSRLDLTRAGLEDVRRLSHDPAKAIDVLLDYYQTRTSVRHPVDRSEKKAMLGKAATDRELQEAEDALKHIFIGQGAYPPQFCGDDINWNTRPVPDNEWVWQLNRMRFWDALADAYWHTGDEKYARAWAAQLVDWTQKNPRDKEHAYAWRSIEAGIRGYRWTGLFQHFIDSQAFTPEVLVAFLNSCYDHASYLMTQYRKGSNWGLMEAEGMSFIAMLFPEFSDAPAWRTEGISRLNAEIDNQVLPDGHQRELAIGYHTGCIGWFKRTLDLASMNGLTNVFPDRYSRTIEKMCEVPFKLGMPDGTTAQFGDSWQGSPGHIWTNLREWGQRLGREDFLYVATEGREGKKPDSTAFALKASGFYSIRSDWTKDAVCLVLKCGPDGGAHCQPDNGTFELYAGGRNLMPDAGSYIYSGNPEGRAWFRQTRVHQTLTLYGANAAYAPRQVLWKPGGNLDVLVVENAGYPSITHRRAVFFVDKQYFVIVDEAIGGGTGEVDVHFQLAPGQALFDSTRMSVRSAFTSGWNVLVQSNPQPGMRLEEEEGWVSFQYTKKEPRPAFRYRIRKTSAEPVRFVTVVAPYNGSAPPAINVKVVGKDKPGDSKLQLKVVSEGGSRRIGYQIPGGRRAD